MTRSVMISLAAGLAVLAGVSAVAGQAAQAPSAGQVRVAGGVVEGFVAPSGVRTFRGIPFAAPPVANLRWREPQPVVPWQGVRPATAFGPRCMQLPIFSDMVFRSNGMGEDCLYLNVWTPAKSAKERLPVLLYYYGGGNVAGDGSELRYDGESMAGKGIVVVTVNYRLGAFGFMAHPELTRESPHHGSGDYGLLDQSAALRWVHDNIAAFGGDPRRVTIGGESAGSIAVSAQMASPLSRGLIAGGIGESGAMIYPTLAPVPLAQAESLGIAFAGRIGATSLAQLRAIPADTLLAMSSRPQTWFPATVDGWFLPKTPAEIYAAGQQAHVPLLVGWNSEESSWRALLGAQQPTPLAYAAAIRSAFGPDSAEALRVFPAETEEQVREMGTLVAGGRFIAYSTWKWAELQGRTGGRPVYTYLYAHPRPATVAPSPNPPPKGAVHSAEIEYALGNLGTNKVFAWTPEDYKVSETLQGYFANFVKKGDPNGPGLPAWPAANADDTGRVMVLNVESRAEPVRHPEWFRFLDRVYTAAARH